MDVVPVLAIAKVVNCVDAYDNGISEIVGVCDCWIGDLLMLKLDSIA